MDTSIPKTLRDAILTKCFDEYYEAFVKLYLQAVKRCPLITYKKTKRYHAIYKHGRILCYIEPQPRYGRVLFGFFRNYIPDARKSISLAEDDFPDWSKSAHGGTLGYALAGTPKQLDAVCDDLLELIEESYKRA